MLLFLSMILVDLKLWQKRVITLYEKAVCDLSFDHVSIEMKDSDGVKIHHFHELGYEICPACQNLAPIINLVITKPESLIKLCDCGYEAPIIRPNLYRNLGCTQ